MQLSPGRSGKAPRSCRELGSNDSSVLHFSSPCRLAVHTL